MASHNLENKLPPGSLELLLPLLHRYPVTIRITRSRSTKSGDYRPPHDGKGHRISINNDLPPPAFLFTLLHELAHLYTWEDHGRKASPHGREWKEHFRHITIPFIAGKVFPEEVSRPLAAYLKNPAASVSSYAPLHLALYPANQDHREIPVADIDENTIFKLHNGKRFKKIGRLRKNIKCLCLDNRKYYLFKPVARVIPVEPPAE